MFTVKVSGKSKSATLKIAVVLLAVLFLVIPGTGLLNIGTSQALAHDDGDDDGWDGKWHHKADACAQTSIAALKACKLAALEDYNLALGNCENVSDVKDQKECLKEAKNDLKDAEGECTDQREARQEVCRELGKGPYDPDSDPADFSDDINNTYFPLVQGQTYTYQSEDTEGEYSNDCGYGARY